MKAKIQVHYKTDPRIPNQINTFFHCGKCLESKPNGISPRDYAQYEMEVTADGNFQIWCKRHECNVALTEIKLKET